MVALLDTLASVEFSLISVGVASPQAWVSVLRRNATVLLLAEQLRLDTITEAELRRWVDEQVATFETGQSFPYQEALAALAVALTVAGRTDAFADEYLAELGALQCAEMVRAPMVARLCLETRSADVYASK